MPLRKYKNLHIYRKKINELLKLNFPQDIVQEMEIQWKGEVMDTANVIFKSSSLEDIKAGIHNYVMHIDIPEETLNKYPYFKKKIDFWFSEVNTWIKSEGTRIRIYPRDRNDYLDNELELERRAYYFITVLQITLAWVKTNMESDENNE